jgi:hypothetical protein
MPVVEDIEGKQGCLPLQNATSKIDVPQIYRHIETHEETETPMDTAVLEKHQLELDAPPTEANLASTRLCDADHPVIVAKANELTAGIDGDEARAERVFTYVRDTFPYRPGEYALPASKILEQAHGMCVTKTVLMSALMRAAGLPTRYRWVPLDKRGFVGFFPWWAVKVALLLSPTVWFHTHCQVFVDGRWATADGLLDRPLYEGLLAGGHLTKEVAPTIEWGRLDADVLQGLIAEDKGVLDNPDEMFEEAQRADIKSRALMLGVLFPLVARHQDRVRRLAGRRP